MEERLMMLTVALVVTIIILLDLYEVRLLLHPTRHYIALPSNRKQDLYYKLKADFDKSDKEHEKRMQAMREDHLKMEHDNNQIADDILKSLRKHEESIK